jgi:hypothetical protein
LVIDADLRRGHFVVMANLDTHAVVKELRAAGFTDEQAEAVTRVVHDAWGVEFASLATKVDLAEVRAAMEIGLAAAKVDLAQAKSEILKWLVGSIGLQTVVILGAVITLVRLIGH